MGRTRTLPEGRGNLAGGVAADTLALTLSLTLTLALSLTLTLARGWQLRLRTRSGELQSRRKASHLATVLGTAGARRQERQSRPPCLRLEA